MLLNLHNTPNMKGRQVPGSPGKNWWVCDNLNGKWTLIKWLIKSLGAVGWRSGNSCLYSPRFVPLDQICLSLKTQCSKLSHSMKWQSHSYQYYCTFFRYRWGCVSTAYSFLYKRWCTDHAKAFATEVSWIGWNRLILINVDACKLSIICVKQPLFFCWFFFFLLPPEPWISPRACHVCTNS